MPVATASTMSEPPMLAMARTTKPSLRWIASWMAKVAITATANVMAIQVIDWSGATRAITMAAARDATHTGSTLNSCHVTLRVYRG